MSAAALRRAGVIGAPVPAALALAVCLTAPNPAAGQTGTDQSRPDHTEAGVSFSALLGPWIRDDQHSEDPVQIVASMGAASKATARILGELARAFAERDDTVMIRVLDNAVVLADGRGATSAFPLDGRQHPLGPGVDGRVLEADETLAIETAASDWRRIDTFFLENDQLVRMTDLEGRAPPGVTVRTVYGRPKTALASDLLEADQPAIRIVPPERRYGELLSGTVEIQTLIVDPVIREVEFLLDDNQIGRVRKRPFKTRIELHSPPRVQALEVLGYDDRGLLVGSDEFILNQGDLPFAVHIATMRGEQTGGGVAVRVEASVSIPRSTSLERVEFYLSQQLAETMNDFGEEAASGAARTISVEALLEDARPEDFIRVVAKLRGGPEREDAKLLQGADYQGEIDVQLVQLQVLVTDRYGDPATGLLPEDFEIRENGRVRPAEDIYAARDVPLVLGLAIDSSGSMLPTWSRLKYIVRGFLQSALAPGDRAFLVDFDAAVRLIQPLTEDQPLLHDRLDRLIPMGGTALNDGLLFSLLQYRREPGRRALVVVTDGADEHSRSRPEQSTDLAERLGLPIYFIELDQSPSEPRTSSIGVVPGSSRRTRERRRARKRLGQISDRTGGRLFQVELYATTPWWTDRIQQVFDQIEQDLRHQQVLTYYSSQPPGTAIEPEVRVTRRGLKLRSVVPLEAIE